MRKIYSILLILAVLIVQAQNTYYKAFDAGAAMSQDNRCLIKTLNGGLAMLAFDSTMNLIRTDINGNVIWKKQFHHSPKFNNPVRLTEDLVDSSFYISTGYLSNSNLSISKISKSGNLLWSKTLPLFTGSAYICSSVGGGFILISSANYDNYLLRFDNGGNIVWQKRYQNSTYGAAYVRDIIQCANNDYVITGSCYNNGMDPQVFRTDSAGNFKWLRTYDLGPDNEYPVLSAKSNDGSILICGTSNNMAYYQDHYLRIDSLGNVLNFRKYHNTHDPSYSVILSTGPNRALLAGSAFYSGAKNSQNLYTYIDYNGNVIWNKTSGNSLYSSAGADYTEYGATNSPNSFILGGYGEGKFIAMIDSSGNGFCNADTLVFNDTTYVIPVLTPTITTGSILYSTTPNVITLTLPPAVLTSYCNVTLGLDDERNNHSILIYPNPVNPDSFFQLDTITSEHTKIVIHDMLGQIVFSSELHTGINKVTTGQWKSGIYFYSIVNDTRTLSSGKICVAD